MGGQQMMGTHMGNTYGGAQGHQMGGMGTQMGQQHMPHFMGHQAAAGGVQPTRRPSGGFGSPNRGGPPPGHARNKSSGGSDTLNGLTADLFGPGTGDGGPMNGGQFGNHGGGGGGSLI